MTHDWISSTLGHGETMCRRCFITNREAAALGVINTCDVPPKPAKVANENVPQKADDYDPAEDYCAPIVCPVTQQACMTEQDEFCEDYGCARKAGINVDHDLIA